MYYEVSLTKPEFKKRKQAKLEIRTVVKKKEKMSQLLRTGYQTFAVFHKMPPFQIR